MQSGTTSARTAREAVIESGAGVQGQQIQLDAPRFFVQMGWSALQVDTNAVPNRYFLRGEITPVRSWQCKTNIHEIREGEKIDGTEEADQGGKVVWAKYWRRAHYEAERLIGNENNATHKSGLVEIRTLNGAAPLYDEIDFNALFFPEGLERIPTRNRDLYEQLQARVAEVRANPPRGVPSHLLSLVHRVGDELLGAVVLAQDVQHSRLQYTHSCMKLKPGDEGFKREYDAVDREMLARTGVPEIHAAEVQTATALNILSERATTPQQQMTDPALLAILEELRADRAQRDKLLDLLLADRESPKPTAAKPQSKAREDK